MRWGSLFVALFLLVVLPTPARADEFPYEGRINSADVYVRSGPGKNYYPTDKLQQGEKVEVYRHDPGGWCAIRPPRQSFSWVSARHLDPIGHGLASATSERVVVRVGSLFSDVRDVIQVRLDKGEKVELLGGAKAADAQWYKIAPPAGEFRWVSSQFIDREDGGDVAASRDEPTSEESDLAQANGDAPEDRDTSPIQLTSGVSPETKPKAAGSARGTPGAERRMSDEEIQNELREIDLELSTMVAEEITAWSFIELRRRAEKCLDDAPTALSRGRVRVVLNKMGRFEELKERHDTVTAARDDTERKNRQLGNTAGLGEGDPSRFDGTGRLSPVVASKTGYPQYALVDSRGQVVMFVNPAPGVNLRPYVNKEVGVYGPRSYVNQLQKQQIDVQRVALLPKR